MLCNYWNVGIALLMFGDLELGEYSCCAELSAILWGMRGNGDVAPLILNLRARWRWMFHVSAASNNNPPEKEHAGMHWTEGWLELMTGLEDGRTVISLVCAGILTQNSRSYGPSLHVYRLSYPVSQLSERKWDLWKEHTSTLGAVTVVNESLAPSSFGGGALSSF